MLLGCVAAGSLGFFSSGMVSDTEKTKSAKTLTINYEGFGGRDAEFPIQIAFPVKTPGKYAIAMTREDREAYEPGSIWPQPDSMYSRGNTLVLVYNNLDKNEKFAIQLFLTPSKAGKWTNTRRVNNEPEIPFWQVIYP